jgi:hypothetical protein
MTYKILSLDGGGPWALIQVKTLQKLYGPNINGHAVLSKFDMAVANSGGSIVLGGLLEDQTLANILGYFMDENSRRSIFQPTTDLIDDVLSKLLHFGPKYSTTKKLPALQRLLPKSGGQLMTQVAAGILGADSNQPVHILIAGFDYDRNIAAFFRSAQTGGDGLEWGAGSASSDVTLAQAIHASSNAPVNFFDQPATWDNSQSRFWDGAIAGCNNPIMTGVAEAATLDVALGDIRALCIGTATVRSPGPPSDNPGPFISKRAAQSFPIDLAKLAGAINDDPPDVASFLAHVATGGGKGLPAGAVSRVVRMNPMVSPVSDGQGGWEGPGSWTQEQLAHLAGVDLTALDQVDIQYISDYADLWLGGIAPNQPLRMDADTLTLKLGQRTFPDALAAWKAITEPPPA